MRDFLLQLTRHDGSTLERDNLLAAARPSLAKVDNFVSQAATAIRRARSAERTRQGVGR
jgi:hypothetical protein